MTAAIPILIVICALGVSLIALALVDDIAGQEPTYRTYRP